MNLPITVTVDVSKATAKLSGPLVLGNTYQVTFQGLTTEQAERHPTLVLLGRPQLTNEMDAGGRGVAAPNVAAMSTVAGVLALNTQEMADVFAMAGLPPQAVAERASDVRKPQTVLPGEVLHGAVRPHAALAMHFYVTTQGLTEQGVDTSADSNGATLAQGDCTVHWAPFEFDGHGNPIILRGPEGPQGPIGPAGIVTWPGCITFQVDADPTSEFYGHLIAWAENRYLLYHDGHNGENGTDPEPHFLVCQADNEPLSGMLEGHIYQIYYPEVHDPNLTETRQYLDLGDVGSTTLFAQTLKSTMEASQHDSTTARTLNETRGKTNSLWTILKNACSALLGGSAAFAIATAAWLLFGAAQPASAVSPRAAERASARASAIARAQSAENSYLVAGWTMAPYGQTGIVNIGSDGAIGNLTMSGGAVLATDAPHEDMGKSLYIDATGDINYAKTACAASDNTYDPLGGATAFTLSAWVKRGSTAELPSTQLPTAARIFSDTSSLNTNATGVEWRFTADYGAMILFLNGTEVKSGNDGGIAVNDTSGWHHLAVTYSGSQIVFYKDGTAKTTLDRSLGAVGANEVSATLGNTVGGASTWSRFLGNLDNVMVYKNWVASAQDIKTIMGRRDSNYDIPDDSWKDAQVLDDMDPTNMVYNAQQIEWMLANVGSGGAGSGDWGGGYAGGGYVAKTNGLWIIVQDPEWTGITWNRKRVFGTTFADTGGGKAKIVGLTFDGDSLVLDFVGAETNHLEACSRSDGSEWEIWDDCTWSYSEDATGTVVIENADEDYWYRVVPDGPVQGELEPVVVSYAPLYVGNTDETNRVATMGDLAKKTASGTARGIGGNFLPRSGYEDNIEPEATNLAWSVATTGAYFRDLTIGGWEIPVVTTNGNEIETNVITQSGLLSVSGGIQFAGSTNQLSYGDGKLRFGREALATANELNARVLELDAATNALQATIADHKAATDNPHSVTAAQVGAPTVDNLIAVDNKFAQYLPTSGGGVITGDLRVVKAGSGRFAHGSTDTVATGAYSSAGGESSTATAQDAYADGYHATASGFAARAHGGWTEATAEYAEAGGRWAKATNKVTYVWQGVNVANQYYGSHGDGTFNINPVGGIDGAYIGDTKLSDHIRRVSGTEWPETCTLYWPTNYVVSNMALETAIIAIPTNFPTHKLDLVVNDWQTPELNINLPSWYPERSVEIDIIALRLSGGNTNRATSIKIGGYNTTAAPPNYSAYNQYRLMHLEYDATSRTWSTEFRNLNARPYFFADGVRTDFPYNRPSTVNEWKAVVTNSAPTVMLTMSPPPSQEDEPEVEDPDEEEPR